MKNKVYKSTIQTSCLVFLFFVSFFLFHCPESNAKYQEKRTDYLKYHSTLAFQKQSDVGTMTLEQLETETATFSLFIPKDSTNVMTNERSNYKLVLPNGCETLVENSLIIPEEEEKIKVEFICNLQTSEIITEENKLDVSVSALESIENEAYFLYKEYHYLEPISKSVELEEKDTTDETMLQFQDSLIQNLLINNPYLYAYKEEIESYIKACENPNEILGLQIDYRDYYDYNYVVLDSFLGYARTYYENINQVDKNVMYFTTDEKTSIEETFEYYLAEYYCFNNRDNYYLISNYIASTDGIYALWNGQTVVPGITLDKTEGKLVLDESLIEKAYELVTDSSVTLYSPESDKKKEFFKTAINQNSTLSNALKAQLLEQEDILNWVSMTYDAALSDKKQFVVGDENDSILLEIVLKEGYNEAFIMPVSIIEQTDSYEIQVYYDTRDVAQMDVISLMNALCDKFAWERQNDTYQVLDGYLTFQVTKKQEEEPPAVINEPPAEENVNVSDYSTTNVIVPSQEQEIISDHVTLEEEQIE